MLEKTLSIIKPDAVERNLENKIQEILEKKGLTIKEKKKVKKYKLLRKKLRNFIKCTRQNHFTMNYVVICRQDLLL